MNEHGLKEITFQVSATKDELARILNVSFPTVDRIVRAGKIEYLKINASVRFTKKHIDDYIAANTHSVKNANDGEK